jgi:cobalt-zinc-cadmium efflux system outer membrane protein
LNTTSRIQHFVATLLLGVLVGVVAVPVHAAPQGIGPEQAAGTRVVTLDEALELFGRNSADLAVARSRVAEAAGALRQAGAFPNPTLTGTHEPLSDGDVDYSESYLNLSQRIEWPGLRSARTREVEARASSARAAFVADSARLAFRVKEVYVRALFAAESEAELDRVAEVFRGGAARAQERLAAGDLSTYDRERIRAERLRYEARLAEVRLEAASARRELALLIAPGSDAAQIAPEPLTGTPPQVGEQIALATAMERRPDLAAARAAVAASVAGIDAARAERLPDVTGTAGYKRQSDGLTGIFLGLAVPLPLWDRNGGAIDVATARATGASRQADLVRIQVRNDVLRTFERYRALVARAELVASLGAAGGAPDLLDIARVAWNEGETELIQLLDAAEAHLDARLAAARLRTSLWTSYFDLERAVGGFDAALAPENDR